MLHRVVACATNPCALPLLSCATCVAALWSFAMRGRVARHGCSHGFEQSMFSKCSALRHHTMVGWLGAAADLCLLIATVSASSVS